MDWYPLWNSLRIALISCAAVFFLGIFAAYYIARLPRAVKGVLTYEEFLRLAALFAQCGIDTVRVTGGEPLVRKNVAQLVAGLKATPGIRRVTLKSLRQDIGIVQQDVYLFSGTVAQNIAYGKPGATAGEIAEAARRANIICLE
jgi:hypothetical protein